MPALTWAAKWEVTPSTSVDYTYSDNINLSQTNRVGDVAITASPQVQIKGKGGRVDLDAHYQMQVVRYRDNTQSNHIYNSASLAANYKIIPDSFNVETNARYGQQAISLTSSPVPQSNINISSNRTNTLTYQLKPVYKGRIGNTAQFLASFNYEAIDYDNTSIQQRHVVNTRYNVALNSTQAYKNLSWSLSQMRNNYGVQDNVDNYDSKTDLTLYYRVANKLSLIAGGGNEQNHIVGSQFGTGGSYWNGGILWQPTIHTSIEVRRWKRFFGDTTSVIATRQGKRSRFSLTYDENFTTTSRIQADTALIPGYVVLATVDEFILQKALYATLSAHTARTELGLTGDRRNLTYQKTLKTEEYTSYSLFLNWNFTNRTSVRISGSRQVSGFIDTQERLTLNSREISFNRSIGKKSSSSFRYINYNSKSFTGNNKYTANIYELTFNWVFK